MANAHARRRTGAALFGARLLFVLLGLALPVGLLEWGMRTFGPILPGNYAARVYLQPHPEYGRFHVPNSVGWKRTSEYTSRVAINSLGLREREIGYDKPANVHRIVVLGDSLVEGSEVMAEKTVTRQLEDLLDGRLDKPVQVINAGVRGFSTDQEYIFLKHEIFRYSPDLVVVAFYARNDVSGNIPRLRGNSQTLAMPHFRLAQGGRLRALPFEVKRVQDEGYVERLRRNSMVFSVFDTGVLSKLKPDDDLADEVGNKPAENEDPKIGSIYYDASSKAWEEAWDVTGALLAAMRNETEYRDASFLMVYIPGKLEVYPHDLDEVERKNLPAGGLNLDSPSQRASEIARRHDLPYLDLLPGLRRAASTSPRLYYQYNGHWTAAGHAVAASELAELLLSDSRWLTRT